MIDRTWLSLARGVIRLMCRRYPDIKKWACTYLATHGREEAYLDVALCNSSYSDVCDHAHELFAHIMTIKGAEDGRETMAQLLLLFSSGGYNIT